MKFISWDFRPAVLGTTEAKALLEPGSTDWVSVDFSDVSHTGSVMDEASWRERFTSLGFGLDNLPVLDQPGLANSEANSIQLFVQDGEEYRSVRLYLNLRTVGSRSWGTTWDLP